MTSSIGSVVLWLYVINLVIAFGAGLYESRMMSGEAIPVVRLSTFLLLLERD